VGQISGALASVVGTVEEESRGQTTGESMSGPISAFVGVETSARLSERLSDQQARQRERVAAKKQADEVGWGLALYRQEQKQAAEAAEQREIEKKRQILADHNARIAQQEAADLKARQSRFIIAERHRMSLFVQHGLTEKERTAVTTELLQRGLLNNLDAVTVAVMHVVAERKSA
jgi:flagellar biosynthesis GTPase FlhF